MYQILSFQLPAQPDVTNEDAVRALVTWVSESQHYDFQEEELEVMLLNRQVVRDYGEDILGKKAALRFCRTTVDHAHYIEMRIENPDEENNLLWRADCIFRQKEDEQAGTFQVTLYREPLWPDKPALLDQPLRIPYIAKQLKRSNCLSIETCNGAGFCSSSNRFPVIFCGAGSCVGNGKQLIKYMKNKLGPIAQVVPAEQAALYLEEADRLEKDGILVVYPIAQVRRAYSLSSGEGNIWEEKVDRAVSDVVRWVTEIHAGTAVPWQEISEPAVPAPKPVQGKYCTIDRSMGKCLRTLRRRNGLSQQELAARVGTTGLIISRLETVRVQRVQTDLLRDLELALGVEEGTISTAQEEPEYKGPVSAEDWQIPEKAGFCRHCGLHLYQDSFFCPKCGTKVLR
ncbi:MAG: helix-turn-helix domain-containing protein [Lawsonibacter sp.]|nr:helix-turn-helix domain-containing protein [Lawsonibacter sp.]